MSKRWRISGASRSRRAMIIVVIACLAVLGSVAIAASDDSGGNDSIPRAETPNIQPALSDAQIQAMLAQQSDEAHWRQTSEAVEDRVDSRTADDNETAAEADQTAEQSFGPALDDPTWTQPPLKDGQQVVAYRGDNVEVLSGDTPQDHAIVDSSLPLRDSDDGGPPQKIDLMPERQPDGDIAPKNGLEDEALPGDASGDVLLKDPDIRLRLANRAAPAQIVGGKLIYANAAEDSDLVLASTPTGVQVYWQARSIESPTSFDLEFSLPDGDSLEPDGTGAKIVRGDELLYEIAPPHASDAQGADVPSSYSINGNTLTAELDHRSGSYAYPVVLDPTVDNYWTTTANPNGGGWHDNADIALPGGWAWGQTVPGFGAQAGSRDWGRGLYTWSSPNTSFPSLSYAWWAYQAPNNSYAYAASFINVINQPTNGTCITEGFYNNGAGVLHDWVRNSQFVQGGSTQWQPGPYSSCNTWLTNDSKLHCIQVSAGNCVDTGSPHNMVGFQSWMWGDGMRYGIGMSYMAGALVYLSDGETPNLTSVTTPGTTGWQTGGTRTVGVSAHDPGLGVHSVNLNIPGTAPSIATQACAGTAAYPCSTDWGHTFTYSLDSLPEGDNVLNTVAYDAGGRGSSFYTWHVKVDRQGPAITTSGPLQDRNGKTIFADTYPLNITATDGSGSAPRSGVAHLTVTLDAGTANASTAINRSQSCSTDSCSMSDTFNLIGADLAPGSHTVTITATDLAGNAPSTKVLTFTTADMDPLPTEQDQMTDAVRFRNDFNLRSDISYVSSLLNDPTLEDSREGYGVPLTASEVAQVESGDAGEDGLATVRGYGEGPNGTSYSGAYIDATNPNIVHVGFTQDMSTQIASLQSQMPSGVSLVGYTAPTTLSHLEDLQQQVEDDKSSLAQDGITVNGTDINEETDQVIVDVPGATGTDSSGGPVSPNVQSDLTGRFGTLVTADTGSASFADGQTFGFSPSGRRDIHDPLIAGLRIYPVGHPLNYCTSGFMIDANFPSGSLSHPAILTAGHCITGAGGLEVPWAQGSNQQFGLSDAVHFTDGARADAGWISIDNNGRGISNGVYRNSYVTQHVTRARSENADGPRNRVCMSGATSGRRCGRIVTIHKALDIDGVSLRSLREASFPCRPGDSGAPVFWGGTAEGIVTAYDNQHCYFSQIGHVQEELHISGFLRLR
jgi:hypothetical protein